MTQEFREGRPHFEEILANPVADVSTRCLSEVRSGLSRFQDQLDAGQPPEYDGTTISRIIVSAANNAAEEGDQAQVEAHMDTLLKLPGVNHALAEVCFAGIRVGSKRAFDVLRGALEAERLQTQEEVAKRQQEFPHILRPYVAADLLEGVVGACEESGTPPDAWIEEYALDNEWRWRLYMQHYNRLAKQGGDEVNPHRRQLEVKAAELVESDMYPADFIYDQTWYTLQVVKDPDLRQRLVQSFVQSSADVRLTPGTFKSLIWVGGTVLQDHALGDKETVEFFERAIETCAQNLAESGMDAFSLAYEQISWRINLKRYYGASPQELIDFIDLQTSQLLSADIAEKADYADISTVLRNREFITQIRDSLLQSNAEYHITQGDFATANSFLSAIMGEASREFAIKGCLEKASTAEEAAHLKPDEMTLTFNPELDLQFRFTEAKLSNDLDALKGLAFECARTIADGNHFIKHDYIEAVHKIVAEREPDAATELDRELLTLLRNAELSYAYTGYLSEALIRAGDTEEPQRTFEDINRAAINPSYRLLNMWELAGLLRQMQ